MDIFKKKIWVNWKFETVNEKKTKVPYQLNGQRASSTNPETWGKYEDIVGKLDGVGIVFEPKTSIIGIDFDNKTEHEFLKSANTYVEYSPSGKGVHLLFHASEPIQLERNKKKFEDWAAEIYTGGRYFTYTGREHPDSKALRTVSQEEFITLITTLGYPWGEEKKQENTPAPTVVLPGAIAPLLSKMLNRREVKELYDGDTSKYQGDLSAADFGLCCHLAFWLAKDKEAMRTAWLQSPLGQREKTQKRNDYQERTLTNAIEITDKVYVDKVQKIATEEGEDFITDKKGKPLLILSNVCKILEKDTKFIGNFRLNDFSHFVETKWGTGVWENLYDNVISDVRIEISENYEDFRAVSEVMTKDAIKWVAFRNKINPPKDYFTNLVWDKVPRLNSWLHTVYGVPDDELHQSMGSNWIKGLVKRVIKPGCIFDEVLALESTQGWRKSTSIRELGKPWHVETTHSPNDKDFYMIVSQNIIVEFAEGDIFDKTSIKKLKAEVTKTEDQFRPPYEAGMIKFKRSCVFAVTTNKLELKDDTGNRRWLPVVLEHPANIDWIKDNRDQLYAEAYYRVIIMGETTYEYPTDVLAELQSSKAEWTANDEEVSNWYYELTMEQREEGVSIKDPLRKIYPEPIMLDRNKEWEIGSILRRSLFLESRNKKIDGKVVKRWFPSERTPKIVTQSGYDGF